jgi:hypothetical protein
MTWVPSQSVFPENPPRPTPIRPYYDQKAGRWRGAVCPYCGQGNGGQVDTLCTDCLGRQTLLNKPLKRLVRGFGKTFHYGYMFMWRYLLTVCILIPLFVLAPPLVLLGIGAVWYKPLHHGVKAMARGLTRIRARFEARELRQSTRRVEARLAAYPGVGGPELGGPGVPEMSAPPAPQVADSGIVSEEVTGQFPVGEDVFARYEGLPSQMAPPARPVANDLAAVVGSVPGLGGVAPVAPPSEEPGGVWARVMPGSPMPPVMAPPVMPAPIVAEPPPPPVTHPAMVGRGVEGDALIRTFQSADGVPFAMWPSPRESQPGLPDRELDTQRFARALRATEMLQASGSVGAGVSPRFFEYQRWPEDVVELTVEQGPQGAVLRTGHVGTRETHVLLREARAARRGERRGHETVETAGRAGMGL